MQDSRALEKKKRMLESNREEHEEGLVYFPAHQVVVPVNKKPQGVIVKDKQAS